VATGKSGSSGFEGRPSDPYVQQRITDPAAAVPRTVTLTGLLGDSDRAGRRRLYFTTSLDYYAEFASADVVAAIDVPADQPPFRGLEATRVELKRDARVEYTHSRVAAEDDQFDLAPRRRRSANLRRLRRLGEVDSDDGCGNTDDDCPPETWEAECNPTFDGGCGTDFGCGTENDCPSGWTVCKPHTCNCTDDGTCVQTCAGTCHNTCAATCAHTCAATCANTCAATCAATCAGTCVHTCAGTCNNTCAGTCGIKCEPTFAQTHCFTCRAGCNAA
jgi:hypothetical protein